MDLKLGKKKIGEIAVEEIHLLPDGDYQAVARAKWTAHADAVFNVHISRHGERRRRRQKAIEEINRDAQTRVASFCRMLSDSFRISST